MSLLQGLAHRAASDCKSAGDGGECCFEARKSGAKSWLCQADLPHEVL